MTEKQQVFQWLDDHADEIQQFLSSLIQIPSVSGKEYTTSERIIEENDIVTTETTFEDLYYHINTVINKKSI